MLKVKFFLIRSISTFSNKIKVIPKHLWILLAIVLLGIFLRTYNLRGWLEFRTDQMRDSYLVGDVVAGKSSWPLLGPYMSYSGDGDHSEKDSFHLGPIYYDFQIIAGNLFGDRPFIFAFPDVLFSILSIPLLYFFLRSYFSRFLSLGIVFLYTVSSYFIGYSRFAWNSNLIPFFVLLFLFSLYKFLADNEKSRWLWVSSFGFALGVGFQLHAITMIVFSSITFLAFIYSLKKNYRAWTKWAVVILMFLFLNAGQIISEFNTNFNNTKTLLNFSTKGTDSKVSDLVLLGNDVSCHLEANAYFLSSYGSKDCSYGISSLLANISSGSFSKMSKDNTYWVVILVGFIFSVIGYFLLFHYAANEKNNNKKIFLRLIILYIGIIFLLMIPLSTDKFSDLRYYMPVFFVPFVFLGLITKYLSERFSKNIVFALALVVFISLAISNIVDISSKVSVLLDNNRTCSSHYVTLGELEPVADYITFISDKQKDIHLGGNKQLTAAVDPLIYLLRKNKLNSFKVEKESDLAVSSDQVFFVSCNSKMKDIYSYKKVGKFYVYQIKK